MQPPPTLTIVGVRHEVQIDGAADARSGSVEGRAVLYTGAERGRPYERGQEQQE